MDEFYRTFKSFFLKSGDYVMWKTKVILCEGMSVLHQPYYPAALLPTAAKSCLWQFGYLSNPTVPFTKKYNIRWYKALTSHLESLCDGFQIVMEIELNPIWCGKAKVKHKVTLYDTKGWKGLEMAEMAEW